MIPSVTLLDIRAAAVRIQGHAVKTPLISHPDLDRRTGGRIYVKAEPLQRTGSFKFRGAFNAISQIAAAGNTKGIAAVSSGNHGQAVAASARHFGLKAVIIMPADAPQVKVDLTRAHGAEILTYDRWTEDRNAVGARVSAERGFEFVPPFDDLRVITGQGTVGLEIMETLMEQGISLDIVLCCCGGGGLIAGTATAIKALQPQAAVYAVEPAGFDDTARSLTSGERESIGKRARSVCDALLSDRPGAITFPINKALLSGGLVVSDQEALAAVGYAANTLRIVAEPGGAVALAAALTGKVDLAGKTVAVVLSGGNIDPAQFAKAVLAPQSNALS